ncbi:carboxypeptidase-like regulatory domain-containing protein [Flavobacterium pedocola]
MYRLFLLVFFCATAGYSQTITGHVFDENKTPMQGVSVYLDGTTIGTTTDQDGKYELTAANAVNTYLIVSIIGYETVIIANPFSIADRKFNLTPKPTSLQELVIAKDPFTRAQKLAVFREQFLGKTKAGKTCKILNENAINFEYDFSTNTLRATSEVPLIVENPYLGYQIDFEIHDCHVKFYKKSIKSSDVTASASLGTTKYTNLDVSSKEIKNRDKLYFGSQKHFFKNLADNIWGAKEFLLFNGSYQDDPNHFFSVTPQGSLKKVTIIGKTTNSMFIGNTGSKYVCTFNLLYDKKRQSKVDFLTNEFYVDQFGNTTEVDKIQFGGDIGSQRIGDLLPVNFVPSAKL